MTRYETLLEAEIEDWGSGRGVVQIVTREDADDCELRFCYYTDDGRFTNRPLTISPDPAVVERASELIENLGYVARTLDPDEIETLVDQLGEERVMELAQLIDALGEARLAEMLGD